METRYSCKLVGIWKQISGPNLGDCYKSKQRSEIFTSIRGDAKFRTCLGCSDITRFPKGLDCKGVQIVTA